MSAVLIYPYRCEACNRRSYTLSPTKTAEATQSWNRIRTQLFVYAFGLLCCLVLVYFLIQERVPSSE